MALPRKQRISKGKDFNRVFREGKTIRSVDFLARVLKNDFSYGRLTVVVPRSVSPKAVERNFLKRIMTEALKDFLILPLDIIIIVRSRMKKENVSKVSRSLKEFFQEANIV